MENVIAHRNIQHLFHVHVYACCSLSLSFFVLFFYLFFTPIFPYVYFFKTVICINFLWNIYTAAFVKIYNFIFFKLSIHISTLHFVLFHFFYFCFYVSRGNYYQRHYKLTYIKSQTVRVHCHIKNENSNIQGKLWKLWDTSMKKI